MSPDPSRHAPDAAAGSIARGDPAAGATAATPAEAGHRSRAAGNGTRRAEVAAITEQPERRRRRFSSPTTRRLGPVEYTLLALIALGIATTFVMAIVNP